MREIYISLKQAETQLTNLLLGAKAETYTLDDIRKITSRVSTNVASANADSIYLLYTGKINGAYASKVAGKVIQSASDPAKFIILEDTAASKFFSNNDNLLDATYNAVARELGYADDFSELIPGLDNDKITHVREEATRVIYGKDLGGNPAVSSLESCQGKASFFEDASARFV